MAARQADTAVVVLVGLPGAGKTTLTKWLTDHPQVLEASTTAGSLAHTDTSAAQGPACNGAVWGTAGAAKVVFERLSFDDHIVDPAWEQQQHSDAGTCTHGGADSSARAAASWKEQRAAVLGRVGTWLSTHTHAHARTHGEDGETAVSLAEAAPPCLPHQTTTGAAPLPPLQSHASGDDARETPTMNGLSGQDQRQHTALRVLIVDDNMYYASMRHEVYQIAREFQPGFIQLVLDCASCNPLPSPPSRRLPPDPPDLSRKCALPSMIALSVHTRTLRPLCAFTLSQAR